MDETRLVGDLPNMRVEIIHGRTPDGSAERMTIQLTAMPSFDSALPTLFQLPQAMGMANPLTAWLSSAEAFTAPWQALMAPWESLARGNPFFALLPGCVFGEQK